MNGYRHNSTLRPGKGFKRPSLEAVQAKRRDSESKPFPELLAAAIAKRKQKADKPRTGQMRRNGKPLRAKSDPKLVAWGKKVRERDGNQCQWPGIAEYLPIAPADFKITIKLAMSPCATGDRRIDAHHIAERSLRPDLRLTLSNGIALCRSHHSFLENHRAVGIALKLISTETYEAARKKAA